MRVDHSAPLAVSGRTNVVGSVRYPARAVTCRTVQPTASHPLEYPKPPAHLAEQQGLDPEPSWWT
ncbi:hypothetical protein GCM10009525_25650 [Streptosporangium amethystogenes subsp. fukuiense]